MSMTTEPAETARRQLARGFEGELIGPSDGSYDETRALYNAMFDKRPAVIARCASNAGVARAVGFARAHELPLAIGGGAHNGGGLGSVEDGVVADLSLLRSVTVDPEARTVRVGGGCTWPEVDAEIAFDGPGVRQVVAGPVGLREGLERMLAGGLRHELRLAGVAYGGNYVLDRCRDGRTGAIVAWGGLTPCRGLITRHTHAPAWDRVRGIHA